MPPAPQGPPPGPPSPPGYYPQQAYYAPGWAAPAAAAVPRRSHRGLWLGLAAGAVVLLVVTGLVVGVTYWTQSRPLGNITSERSATARQVNVGHCIADLPYDGPVARVRLVPCGMAHEAEVVDVMTLAGGRWPSQASVDEEVGDWCEMADAQREAGFWAVIWTPSERGWNQGDRRGVCIAWHSDGPVTGYFVYGDNWIE